MSIVMAVANTKRVVVKSDGLARDKDTGEIKSEDFEKILNLNNNCIVGFTGIKEYCEFVLNEYKRLADESKVDISILKPTTVIYDLCELSKEMFDETDKVSFLVAGIEDNKIVLFGFTSMDGFEINNLCPEDDLHIKYIALGSEIQKNATPYSKFYSSDKAIEFTMNEYIRFISSIDPSVNNHIFTRKIKINIE